MTFSQLKRSLLGRRIKRTHGLALPRSKPGLIGAGKIRLLGVSQSLTFPLINYQREYVEPLVTVGQSVQAGDELAASILCSSNGIVRSIEPQTFAHPSGEKVLSVTVTTDSDSDELQQIFDEEPSITLNRIDRCAIHGLGGAAFKTVDKMQSLVEKNGTATTLIINAVECEPLISCDESLLLSEPDVLARAIVELFQMQGFQRCIIAIEDDKTEAIVRIKRALAEFSVASRIEIKQLAPIYPAGAERPLIERVCGISMATHEYPGSFGILCLNVATVWAIHKARLGFPMLSRVVSIAGELATNATNVRVRFGTAVADVLNMTDNPFDPNLCKVRLGGPMSGYIIDDLSVPITASINSITLELKNPPQPIQPCIRCGACSDVCPAELLPQQLYSFAINENIEKSEKFGIAHCIECGCCDAVCPSNIPLTQSFRYSKGLIREKSRRDAAASLAEHRFEIRETRQAVRAEQRQIKREAARQRLATETDPIAAALARSKKRRKKNSAVENSPNNQPPIENDLQANVNAKPHRQIDTSQPKSGESEP